MVAKKNKCWFANRIVEIKTKYHLTVDNAEAYSLEAVLSKCETVEMVFFPDQEQLVADISTPASISANALSVYDDNNNGRITCAEARGHGIAPVTKDHPAYAFMNDRDNDGVACE